MLARGLLQRSAFRSMYRRSRSSLSGTTESRLRSPEQIMEPPTPLKAKSSPLDEAFQRQHYDYRLLKQASSSWPAIPVSSLHDDDESTQAEQESTTKDKPTTEKMKELRIRAALSLFKALTAEANAARAAAATSNQQSRSFTSDSKNKPPEGLTEPSTNKTEPDFAEYLTAKVEDEAKDIFKDEAKAQYDEEPIKQFKLPDSVPSLESEDPTEAYRSLRQKQRVNLVKVRDKTSANVRRALYGNLVICAAKLAAWISSGSSSMLSEFIHSVVDCGNQSLLLVGLHDATNVPDRKHPYGYGKSVYFWALVSALGTFFLGAGVSATHAIGELMEPSIQDITWHVWAVLGFSFTIDGYVFGKTLWEVNETKPADKTLWSHISNLRDPATLAILLEDGAACLGILMAIAGIGATQMSGMPVFDAVAGVSISALLATMGLVLVRVNHRFLLGQAVDRDITDDIEQILRSQRSIDNVQSVQSQWTSSETFSYKAEVDFDGTFLAAKLMPRYQAEFLQVKDTLDEDLRVLLSWYAEDVIRTVEREVRHIEAEIRRNYPGAEYIELEPMSKDANRFAIDDGVEAQLRRIELEALNRYLKSLYQQPPGTGGDNDDDASTTSDDDNTDKKK